MLFVSETNVLGMDEVEETIAHVGIVVEIDGEIHQVEASTEAAVQELDDCVLEKKKELEYCK